MLMLRSPSREQLGAEFTRALQETTAELRRLGEEKERESAQIDARGLPVVGFGILLSDIPEKPATLAHRAITTG
ncbi:MAG: hypothetical protein M3257_09500 [Actinomycetota bacterium]|nr:hypothetical protein [Actinomycetota bacterium]